MKLMKNNPFDITKAVEYTDDEIYKYWVSIDGQDFMNIMKPQSLMPMIIVGSKGSGKTHIMKYYSYELQKIKCIANNIPLHDGLNKEKFIGIYIRCSGFNAAQFSGGNVSNELWQKLYAYFWELWTGERVINTIIDLVNEIVLDDINECDIVNKIMSLFLRDTHEDLLSFKDLQDYLLKLQRDVEYQIQNYSFHGQKEPSVEILLSPNRLTYGIPAILKDSIPFFKNKYIMYLIDELENFSENQQELIQSLIREKNVACTFRIGTRPYGIRTYYTINKIEENHEGSEFEKIVLDEILRNYEKYNDYVKHICINRLINSDITLPQTNNKNNFDIDLLIENPTTEDLLNKIASKSSTQTKTAINHLKNNLSKVYPPLSPIEIEEIMNNIKFDNDAIIERTNIVLFYRRLKDKKNDMVESSKAIKESAEAYYSSKNMDTEHFRYLNHYRQDVIDTVAREGREPIPYYGIDRLVELSCGTPRTILRLLKTAFSSQYFNTGMIPFEDGNKLTVNSQMNGIRKTYEWFFEENRIPAPNLKDTISVINRLGTFLQEIRFSDVPPQCSISIFSIPNEGISDVAKKTIETLLKYSYIIELKPRRQKNSVLKIKVYRLNSILLPKWELSISQRGMVDFNATETNLIFGETDVKSFEDYCKRKLKEYNYPFMAKTINQDTLF